ncbi:Tex-like protein N-terminal domain protein [Filifactor alocis ATCC 35896]|uniref:Tex-like protein N-terminal domain protein n=1 Tax=Filifactor alocis (strain ATCC 35896 / CCUG 47790 / D40 B5) TaxID=546269 RepID=D6GTA9_FILAD|nr:Tex family protein [Filifactor alocis]EFE27716.1 Tex-like protein N-terminal domain protein [Filifactor alocis ATCC 35896]
MNLYEQLAKEFGLKKKQVEGAIHLIDEGNTIPFIARYRKEATGEMSDEVLRDFYDRLKYLRNLEDRKQQVKASIEEQNRLTPEIISALQEAKTLVEVEDIYEPYKKKRKTRASVAIEKGLEPLSYVIRLGEENLLQQAQNFVNEENEVLTAEDALQGAMDIVAQQLSEDFERKKKIRNIVFSTTKIETSRKKSAEEKEGYLTYSMYFEYNETAKDIPPHRILAINRGEKEDILKVKYLHEEQNIKSVLMEDIVHTEHNEDCLNRIVEDALKRLILPSLERELRSTMTETAEERAIEVFGQNLKDLLLQGTLPNVTILGWDPAFRTGCKIAVIDCTGKVLDTATIYPTAPQNKVEESKKVILNLIDRHQIDVIAIGNGTASRESEEIVREIIKESKREVHHIIVNEAGASVYSASKLGTEEFPDMNVSLRGAVSIARRLADPLAELVKISPEHIGVGQYQHDVNQGRLLEVLKGVVENAVNTVGIDLNTASSSLLGYVSGITPSIAKNIIEYRETNGAFRNRKELLKVKRLGASSFEQCAGFLRIKDGTEVLDNTLVHPESYDKAYGVLYSLHIASDELDTDSAETSEEFEKIDFPQLATQLEVGIPTLKDIVSELKKPGRDIRPKRNPVEFLSEIMTLDDLKEDMVLTGTVRNVLDFGAFVDIGLKSDGLVHISELSDKYVKHPLDIVRIGDIVTVRVIKIDRERGKVGLSMKQLPQH